MSGTGCQKAQCLSGRFTDSRGQPHASKRCPVPVSTVLGLPPRKLPSSVIYTQRYIQVVNIENVPDGYSTRLAVVNVAFHRDVE